MRPRTIDHDSHDRSKEEIQKCCKKCPADCPSKDTPELLSDISIEIQNSQNVSASDPVKQDHMIALLGVIGKCHAHHIDQRQYRENRKKQNREKHQQILQIIIQQSRDI